MDPFADAIALLSLVGSGITFWLGRREGRKRKLWEEEQEKRQIAFTQPDLVPTGGRYEGIFSRNGEPMRFSPAGEHVIPLHNEGGSTPSQVVAVLFPSEWYWKLAAGEEFSAQGGFVWDILGRRVGLVARRKRAYRDADGMPPLPAYR